MTARASPLHNDPFHRRMQQIVQCAMRTAAAVALSLMAMPLSAQTSWFQVHGFATARGISVDAQPSWTQNGYGVFDVGSTAAGERRTENVEVGQLGFDLTPTSWLLVHADGIARREPAGTVGKRAGVVQGFADIYTERMRLRAGAFWLPTSRENVDPMWNSRYTITYSALNTWIAQEVRPVGADLQFSPNFYITAGATAFGGVSTMGTALAGRGWTLGNRLSVYNEEIALPPPSDITRPIRYESDNRVGVSERLRLQLPERAMIQFTHVDNRARLYPGTPPDEPWNTRFDIVGAEVGSTAAATVAGEWMYGRTAVVYPGGEFTMDFNTAYILVSRKSGNARFTTRYERFTTRAHNPSPRDSHRENGHAVTFSWLHDMGTHLRAGLEYVHATGQRPALMNPNIGGSTWTAELRFGF